MGFGWTITHIKDIKDSAAPLGGSIILASVLSIVFKHLLEQSTHKNHVYDSISSFVLLMFKIFIALVFLLGVFRSYHSTNNIKSKNFLK